MSWVEISQFKSWNAFFNSWATYDSNTFFISNLNIRIDPGTSYGRTGAFTDKGTFGILQKATGEGSSAGRGKHKSGAGWIALD